MIEVLVPRENVNDESVVILEVNFASGSIVKKGDVVLSIETSKTNIDIDAPEDGIVTHMLEKGIEINVGMPLFSLSNVEGLKIEAKEHFNSQGAFPNVDSQALKAKFSNAAVIRAKELGVILSQFEHGWVTSTDIEKHAGVFAPTLLLNQSSAVKIRSAQEEVTALGCAFKKVTISKRKQAEAKNLITGDHGNTTSTVGIEIKLLGERLTPLRFFLKKASLI